MSLSHLTSKCSSLAATQFGFQMDYQERLAIPSVLVVPPICLHVVSAPTLLKLLADGHPTHSSGTGEIFH